MKNNTINILNDFPLSWQTGSSTDGINADMIKSLSESEPAITQDEFTTLLSSHSEFLAEGGAGGTWQTFVVGGIVFGIYQGAIAKAGNQMGLKHKHNEQINMKEVQMPYTNGVGMLCKNADFSKANLSGSLFTDSDFEYSIFEEANLEGVDFSRSNLQNCNFKNANLAGADFENCDCTGADFRGAVLTNSRFPCAKLDYILR